MDQIKKKELEQKINSQYGNITGIVIIKNGMVSCEKYFKGCTASSCVHVYSVTKSIISILFGIALDKGYIKKCPRESTGLLSGIQSEKGREKNTEYYTEGYADNDGTV